MHPASTPLFGPPASQSRATTVVVIPVYKPRLSAIEAFTLEHSLSQLAAGRPIVLTGPEGLDLSYYRETFARLKAGAAGWQAFEGLYFASISGYSRLLTSRHFYQAFQQYDFSLVLQTDALLLRDELDHWTSRPFDYIGAPWPKGVEIFVNLDRHDGDRGQHVRAMVGNGGLSLRRNAACIDLLAEFPQGLEYFQRSGSSEDLFFAMLGSVSTRFVLPNEMTAARFALELQPRRYHAIHGRAPMGGHAWWKYDPAYWLEHLGPAAPAARKALASLVAPAPDAAREPELMA